MRRTAFRAFFLDTDIAVRTVDHPDHGEARA